MLGATVSWRGLTFEVASFDAEALLLRRRFLVHDHHERRFALLSEAQQRRQDQGRLEKRDPHEEETETSALMLMSQKHKRRLDEISVELKSCARRYRTVELTRNQTWT
jgi:hypothetical protein